MSRNCWEILGVDSNADLAEIKKAYARLSREYHPEEHPEEYRELKEAYQEASRSVELREKTRLRREVDCQEFVANQQLESFTSFKQAEDSVADNCISDDNLDWDNYFRLNNLYSKLASFQGFQNMSSDNQGIVTLVKPTLEKIEANDHLTVLQKKYANWFVQQAIRLYLENKTSAAWWRAFLEKTAEWFEVEQQFVSHSQREKFFGEPEVTKVLLPVLAKIGNLEYPVWNVLDEYLLPKRKKHRMNEMWKEITEQFSLVRAYRIPGHVYRNKGAVVMKYMKSYIYDWVDESLAPHRFAYSSSYVFVENLVKIVAMVVFLVYMFHFW